MQFCAPTTFVLFNFIFQITLYFNLIICICNEKVETLCKTYIRTECNHFAN